MRPIELGSRCLRWGTAGLFLSVAALGGCFPDPPLAAIADGSELADAEIGVGEVVDVLAESEIAEDVVEADNSVSESFDGQEVDAEVDADAEADVADGEIEPVVNACGGDGVLTPGEPGTACGPCLDGELVCVASDPDLNTTICENATTLNACGGCGKLAHELDGACDECGLYGCDPGGSTDVVCIEPAAGCFTPMLCDDLACESQGRLCIEGDADTDAVCGDCLDEYVAVDDACLPVQLPPENVTASSDRASDVEVRWDAAASTTGYRVFRCDEAECTDDADWSELTESPIATTTFIDDAVAVPSAPSAPTTVTASADRTDKVVVTWSAVVAGSAVRYAYRVVAEGPAGASEPSLEASGGAGERAIEAYQVRADGGAWTTIALAAGMQWEDLAALPATLTAPTVTASQGTYAEYVRLSAVGAKATDGAARQYEVRAVNAHEPGASGAASGKRTAGALALQWERSASTNAANFTAIAGAVAATFDDTGAPADGSVRWYRVSVTATGAEPVASTSTSGARKAPPGVPGNVSATIDLNDKVTVTWGTVSDAIGYHVYRDGQKLTSGNGVTGTSYDDFGAPAPTTNWDAPTGVVATTNDPTNVTVTWTAPVRPLGAAASYEVLAVNAAGEGPRSAVASGRRSSPALVRFEVEVAADAEEVQWFSTGGLEGSWVHTNAPPGKISGGTTSVSQGTMRNSVHLAYSSSTVTASSVSYRVRGLLQTGNYTPSSSSILGQRAVGSLSYQWQRSQGTNPSNFSNLLGATGASFDDVTAPSDGGHRWYQLVTTAAGTNVQVSNPQEGWRLVLVFLAIDGGESHTCALDATNMIWCWGDGSFGKLGRGTGDTGPSAAPVSLPVGVSGFVEVSAGATHSCARSVQGDIWCWGENFYGQLGDGSTVDRSVPVKVVGLSSVISLSVNGIHSCAVTSAGNTFCWGRNDYGVLGNNSYATSSAPVMVLTSPSTSLAGALDVQTGLFHTCARRLNDVYCWGGNTYGQLGNQNNTDSPVAVPVVSLAGVAEISLGGAHSCARLSAGGEVKCWGYNNFGELGDGTAINRSAPVSVPSIFGAAKLVALGDSTCVKVNSGTVSCWGRNDSGQLGNGTIGAQSNNPAPIAGLVASTIGGGYGHVCATTETGPKCWGSNSAGQLGDGTTTNSSVPVAVVLP